MIIKCDTFSVAYWKLNLKFIGTSTEMLHGDDILIKIKTLLKINEIATNSSQPDNKLTISVC